MGVNKRMKAIPELREGSLILRKRPPSQDHKESWPSIVYNSRRRNTLNIRVRRNQIVPFQVNNETVDHPDDNDPNDPIIVMLLRLLQSSDTL